MKLEHSFTYRFPAVCLLAALTPLVAGTAHTETVRNQRVAVIDGSLQPRGSESLPGAHPSVTVYFTDGSLEIAPTGGKSRATSVKRGDVVFDKAQPRVVRNTGSGAVRFVRVELLGKGIPETWGAAGLSPNYKMLLENQYTRVYDIRIAAGTREPQHSHHDRVVICLSGAKLSHLMPDGREEPSTLKTGESTWRRGGTHIGQNLGNTDLWVIAVEPK